MEFIESRVKTYRKEICDCISSEAVMSRMPDIIPQVQANRLRQRYDQDHQDATGQMLDIVIRSREPRKWQQFLQALKDEKYEYLADLLSTETSGSCDEREKRIIQIFWPLLSESVSSNDIVGHLYSFQIITMEDMQEINSKYNNRGQRAGTVELLIRMQKRQKSEIWYRGFLEALYKTEYYSLLQELEPDFLESRKLGASESMETSFSPPTTSTTSAMECTVTDYVEAHSSSKNLSAPAYANDTKQDKACLESQYDKPDPSAENLENDCTDGAQLHTDSRKRPSNSDLDLQVNKKKRKARWVPKDKKYTYNDSEELTRSSDDGDRKENESSERDIIDNHCRLNDENTPSDNANNAAVSEQKIAAEQLNLRNYQLELSQNALRGENTIICSGTGSGKTRVAMYIVHKHLQQKKDGKVVFMARQSTLIKQQADKFKEALPIYECKLLTGEEETSLLLGLSLENYDIFFMTPQILLNNLERNKEMLNLHSFSLFIFDECHHTKKEEPYNKLMRLYLEKKHSSPSTQVLPQVVGLTASIGVGNSYNDNGAKDYILSICANLDARSISTVEDKNNENELKKYTPTPTEEIIRLVQRPFNPCETALTEAMEDIEADLEELAVLSEYHSQWNARPRGKGSQEYTNWTVDLMNKARRSGTDQETSRNILSCATYLSIMNAALEVNSLLMMDDVNKFLYERLKGDIDRVERLNDFENALLRKMKGHVKRMSKLAKGEVNPNLRKLSDSLRNALVEEGNSSRAMVFVKSRWTCKRLAEYLENELQDVDAGTAPLYGKETRRGEEGMTESKQHETVDKFREGIYKVLVATSVGSEGIDIPDCNIVLNYNNTGNEIQKIQMSGRVRSKKGGCTITIGDEKAIEKERINVYKSAMMYRAIKLVKPLPKKEYERKLNNLQEEELRKARTRRSQEEHMRNQRTDKTLYEIRCSTCGNFGCLSSDVRTLQSNHHVVVNKDFAENIDISPLESSKSFDGLTLRSIMKCKGCGKNWGHIIIYRQRKCWTLLLKAFKFVNPSCSGERNHIQTFKKWIDVPFKRNEISDNELTDLLSAT